jgi:capsular exopolysaccharide synthesis family protein
MTSRLVAGHVVDALDLVEDPAFNKYFGTMEQSGGEAVANNDLQRDEAISTLLSQLSVSRKGESLAISIRVANTSPKLAAKIADSVADTYVDVSMDFKRQFANKALQFLKERGSNPLLTALRNEDAKLQQTRAELAAKFGNNHPEIQAIEAKIEQVRVMISGEFTRMSEDLDNETERPSARVLSRAQIPTETTYPKSNMIILGTFAGSALLSIIMALVAEGLGTAIRSGEQTMQLLQIPNLAYVPIVRKSWIGPRLDPVQEILKQPQAGFAVSMRSLYLACRLPNSDRPHQVIMLTSCLPGEGKTKLSIGLVATAAADGRKTALVDLNGHNCKILKTLKLEAANRSLDSFLSGECGLSDIVCQSPDLQGLSVISSAQPPFDPSAFLSSDRLRQLVAVLRTEFDFIVIDSPPVLSVDDANWLAPLVDAAILVLTWGSTKESEVWDAASSLRLHQAPLIGTVINEVNPRLQSRFGLGKVVQ